LNYQRWKYPENNLVVEKYANDHGIEDILQNGEGIYDDMKEGKPLFHLVDIAHATFSQLKYEELGLAFREIDNNSEITHGMKMAIHTGSLNYEDFSKAIHYAELSSDHGIHVVTFNFLSTALNWLRIPESLKPEISGYLQPFSR
jgi:hypothetical protein